jgi:hypothetical protein
LLPALDWNGARSTPLERYLKEVKMRGVIVEVGWKVMFVDGGG